MRQQLNIVFQGCRLEWRRVLKYPSFVRGELSQPALTNQQKLDLWRAVEFEPRLICFRRVSSPVRSLLLAAWLSPRVRPSAWPSNRSLRSRTSICFCSCAILRFRTLPCHQSLSENLVDYNVIYFLLLSGALPTIAASALNRGGKYLNPGIMKLDIFHIDISARGSALLILKAYS